MSADRWNVRVWDTGCKYMIHFAPAFELDDDRDTLTMYAATGHQVLGDYDTDGKRFVRMMSTGITDRDGVEIFEGDMVETATARRGKVFSRLGCWYVEDISELGYLANLRVIGNIYENPELQQKGKQ